MSRWPKLHPHQVDLLRRIADGGNPVTAAELALAATVYALRRRHLVSTPRAEGVWTAAITDAGRYYLKHGSYPPPTPGPAGRRTARPLPAASAAAAGAGRSTVSPEDGHARSAGPADVDVPVLATAADAVPSAAGLIQALQQHPVIRVSDPPPAVRAAWRRAIHAANSRALLGDSHRLRHRGRDHGDLVTELHTVTGSGADAVRPDRAARAAIAITVPAELTDPHPVVRALQQRPEQVTVSTSALPRALRLIQAFAAAATARGHQVDLPTDGPGIRIAITGHPFVLLLREEDDTADVLPDDDELAQRPVYAWQRFQPERRRLPSGRLVLELDDPRHRFRSRTGRWADRTRWRLDDRLADALAEVEARATLTQQAEDAAAEAAVTRRRDWEQAMAAAHEQYTQAYLNPGPEPAAEAVASRSEDPRLRRRARRRRARHGDAGRTAGDGGWAPGPGTRPADVDRLDAAAAAPAPTRRVADPGARRALGC
jgi:hypothetical protein